MASVNDQPTTLEEQLRLQNKRLIALERKRNGDGVLTVDGDCVFGGGSGGDSSYYGGNTDFPPYDFPGVSYPPYFPDWVNDYLNQNPDLIGDWLNNPANQPFLTDWLNDPANQDWLNDYLANNGYTPGGGGGGTYTAGPNIEISGSNVVRVSVPFVEPTGSDAPPGIFWFDELA